MKKITKVLAVVLAVAGVSTVAGCKNTPDNRIAISANWNVKCDSAFEDAYFDDWTTHVEEALYKVTFVEGTNTTYKMVLDSVTEGEGESQKTVVDETKSYYKTTFTMEDYNWADCPHTSAPEGFAPENPTTEKVYVYTTELKLTGKYVITATGEELAFENVTTTVVKFRSATNYLAPIYSKTVANVVSPYLLSAPSSTSGNIFDYVTVRVNSVYETVYSYDLKKVCVETTDNTQENPQPQSEVITVHNDDNYSIYDNSMIRFALRGASTSSAHSFYAFSPQNRNMQMCTSSAGTTAELNPASAETADPIQTDIITALSGAPNDYIFFDGTGETPSNPRYTAVTLSINSNMQGQSMTQWYATVENRSLNATRSVLFAYTAPQPFGLGQVNYHLKSLDWKTKAA